MKKAILVVVAVICLLAAPLAFAQGGNPPASTKESRATSGKGMTAVEQTGKGGGNAEEQIRKLTDQMIAVQLKADTNSYAKLLADEYTAIRSDGTLSTKAQDVENFKSGVVKYETVDVHDSKVRVYGDTAVITLLLTFKGTISGKPFSGDTRTTRIWVKEKGNWKCVAFQATRVLSASQ